MLFGTEANLFHTLSTFSNPTPQVLDSAEATYKKELPHTAKSFINVVE